MSTTPSERLIERIRRPRRNARAWLAAWLRLAADSIWFDPANGSSREQVWEDAYWTGYRHAMGEAIDNACGCRRRVPGGVNMG